MSDALMSFVTSHHAVANLHCPHPPAFRLISRVGAVGRTCAWRTTHSIPFVLFLIAQRLRGLLANEITPQDAKTNLVSHNARPWTPHSLPSP